MNQPSDRLRPPPNTRATGPAVQLNLPDLALALRNEPHPAKSGHRQTGLIHHGSLRLLLFAFEPGGRLTEHQAQAHIVMQCLRGRLSVQADGQQHLLGPGEAVALAPEVPHSVEALIESDMLLTVCMG